MFNNCHSLMLTLKNDLTMEEEMFTKQTRICYTWDPARIIGIREK